MDKTLNYLVTVKVPDDERVRDVKNQLAHVLQRDPTTRRYKPKVSRPHGRLGAIMRRRDKPRN